MLASSAEYNRRKGKFREKGKPHMKQTRKEKENRETK
jgi:hypothetical protein